MTQILNAIVLAASYFSVAFLTFWLVSKIVRGGYRMAIMNTAVLIAIFCYWYLSTGLAEADLFYYIYRYAPIALLACYFVWAAFRPKKGAKE